MKEVIDPLLYFERSIFWEYSEREISKLGPEFVVPRVTRYGTLEEMVKLFLIYPKDAIKTIVDSDRELDEKEKALLNFFCRNAAPL